MSRITINERKEMTVSGVRSVETLTDSEIFIYTDNGDLIIKGSGLISEEFDPSDGLFRLSGKIDSVCYTTEKYHLSDNIFSKIFR